MLKLDVILRSSNWIGKHETFNQSKNHLVTAIIITCFKSHC